jgi:glucosylceramidase
VVTIDSRTGTITRNQEYYAFGHASRFVRPGARRVASVEPEGLQGVAFVNPDGERVLIVLNEAADGVSFSVREGGRHALAILPGRTAATYVWRR